MTLADIDAYVAAVAAEQQALGASIAAVQARVLACEAATEAAAAFRAAFIKQQQAAGAPDGDS